MRPKERIRLSRFIEKLGHNSSYAKQLGVSFGMVRKNDSDAYMDHAAETSKYLGEKNNF